MTKIRGFELVSTYNNQELLPKRETAHAAGYDLKVAGTLSLLLGKLFSSQQVLRLTCNLVRSSISMTVRQTLAKKAWF